MVDADDVIRAAAAAVAENEEAEQAVAEAEEATGGNDRGNSESGLTHRVTRNEVEFRRNSWAVHAGKIIYGQEYFNEGENVMTTLQCMRKRRRIWRR